jgi:vacuolar-type H+-ATPase subunit I/STV1
MSETPHHHEDPTHPFEFQPEFPPQHPQWEPHAQHGSWTPETLYLHFSQRISELDRRVLDRFEAQQRSVEQLSEASERALTKAETATENRFASVNEFRAVLTEQSGTLATRSEVNIITRQLEDRVREIQSRMDRLQGNASGFHAGWSYVIAGVAVSGTLIAILIALFR